jgi:hypothetical protein
MSDDLKEEQVAEMRPLTDRPYVTRLKVTKIKLRGCRPHSLRVT